MADSFLGSESVVQTVGPPPSHFDTYKLFRQKCESENTLTNNRLTWLFTIHGFLFAAYALCLQSKGYLLIQLTQPLLQASLRTDLQGGIDRLADATRLMALTGILVSLCVLSATTAAQLALWTLHTRWKRTDIDHKADATRYGMVATDLPGLLGGGRLVAFWLGLVPPVALPFVFIVIWLVVFRRPF